MVGGGSHRLARYVCKCSCVLCVCVCLCALVHARVCLIGCVLEQVSQVDVLLLSRALWALCEHCYWMARGLPVAMGGRIWSVSCLWKIWSAQVCEEILSTRYSVDRVRCELRDPKKGVVGSYYCHISQREIKKVIVLA